VDDGAQPVPGAVVVPIPQQFPHQADLLEWCRAMGPGSAVILVFAGIIYLMFGFKVFKFLVMLNAAVFGAYLGAILGKHGDAALGGALIGGVVAAAIAWPTMRFAVAAMGGTFGAVLGASLWRTANLDPNMAWAGAVVGLATLGLLSFILFRGSVMMFTSLQGASMLVFGILGLIFKYPEAAQTVADKITLKPLILPAAVLVPALIGLVFQQHHSGPTAAAAPAKK
jgi:hypothetical protein